MKFITITLIFIIFKFIEITSGYGQNNNPPAYPEVGNSCPDFALTEVSNFHKTKVSLGDFKGKWLIIDFWSSVCVACVNSFPKMNDIQNEYKEKLQVLLVGQIDGKIRPMYDKLKEKMGLNIPVAFDTTLFNNWGVDGVPHIVIIDGKGIVRAVTISITKEVVEKFISGEDPHLPPMLNSHQRVKKQLSTTSDEILHTQKNMNLDSGILFRSTLTKWNPSMDVFIQDMEYSPTFEIRGASMEVLYRMAFTGKFTFNFDSVQYSEYGGWVPRIICEGFDSNRLSGDLSSGENVYCYKLYIPKEKADINYIKGVMQNDLLNYFGWKAKVEERMVLYWKLIANKNAAAKLISKSKSVVYTGSSAGFSIKGVSVNTILNIISSYHQREYFKDETGITSKIDLDIDALLTDLDDVRKELKRNGFDLVHGKKKVKVILLSPNLQTM